MHSKRDPPFAAHSPNSFQKPIRSLPTQNTVMTNPPHPPSDSLTKLKAPSRAANAAGIASALGLLASEAAAQVTLLTPSPQPFTNTGSGDVFITIDPDSNSAATDTSLELMFYADPSAEEVRLIRWNTEFDWVVRGSGAGSINLDVLSANDPISAANTVAFTTTCGPAADISGLSDGESFFLGYGFRTAGSEASYSYSWVELSFSYAGATNTLSVKQWAYHNTAGSQILAGQGSAVPEPSSAAAAIGLAAVVMAVFGRRRQRAVTP